LVNAGTVIKANRQVRAVSYFESDPDPRDRAQQFAISDDPTTLSAFTRLSSDPYFTPRRRATD
jgi:hypothetical protein